MLCTSGFMDDMFSHNGANGPDSKTMNMFRRVRQVAAPGCKSAVSECILFYSRDAMLARYLPSACVCLSVCLSVCPSVRLTQVGILLRRVEPMIMQTTPCDSPLTLVFCTVNATELYTTVVCRLSSSVTLHGGPAGNNNRPTF